MLQQVDFKRLCSLLANCRFRVSSADIREAILFLDPWGDLSFPADDFLLSWLLNTRGLFCISGRLYHFLTPISSGFWISGKLPFPGSLDGLLFFCGFWKLYLYLYQFSPGNSCPMLHLRLLANPLKVWECIPILA